jgi:hypothetical protein
MQRVVTAMPLLHRGMRHKAKRFAGRLRYRARSSSIYARGLPQVKFNIDSDWWDALFKMLSIVLVPLTVAGMGWYWTRWQQNVNDLKGMIDLVTDQSPEKQKYGIAMFEYLAKNGKVPVEFIAAQIDYATSAQNKELLPMLEVAIQNASKENPEVADAYRVALERRPGRVFIHVPNDESYTCLVRLREAFKDGDKASIIFPGVRKFPGYAGSNQELRFFHADDKDRATQIVGLFGTLGLELAVKDISATVWARTNAPNSYELWFTGKPMPKICEQAANG